MPALTLQEFIAQVPAFVANVEAVTRHRWFKKDPDALAATATPETPFGTIETSSAVSLLRVIPKGAVTFHAANFATVTIRKRAQDGTTTTLGSVASNAASWLKEIPLPITPSTTVAAGELVTAEITKAGTGVIVPPLTVELLPAENFITQRIAFHTSRIEARLFKRYAVPFASPVPRIFADWLVALVTLDMFKRRGFDPTSKQDAEILQAAEAAIAEIKEAADSKDGLFELPLRQDLQGTSGVTRGGPLSYSEQDPYTWTDKQFETVRG